MFVASWSEHLQQHERMTKNELQTWERVWRLHRGKSEPVVKHYLSRNRELLMRRNTNIPIEDAPVEDQPAKA